MILAFSLFHYLNRYLNVKQHSDTFLAFQYFLLFLNPNMLNNPQIQRTIKTEKKNKIRKKKHHNIKTAYYTYSNYKNYRQNKFQVLTENVLLSPMLPKLPSQLDTMMKLQRNHFYV